MDKELQENYSLDFAQQTQILRQREGSTENSVEMVDYMLSNHPPPQHQLSFADVMQFADFGPKLGHNQGNKTPISEDDSYFFKFNFMTADNKIQEGPSSLPPPPPLPLPLPPRPQGLEDGEEEEGGQFSENASSMQQQQLGFGGGGGDQGEKIGGGGGTMEVKNRRKRPRSMKTSEEVESQRMTHIAVERNRRRQMNEHLHVLRSLMPGSYFQRGDQASIIGGAIEFVRELEQLLQCLESQKRRRLLGGAEPPPSRNMADAPPLPLPIQEAQQQQRQQPPFFPPLPLPFNGGDNNMRMLDLDTSSNIHEDMAENKSCLADIQVRVLGFDAMIKILSRRSSGQLIKTIAALEDLQFNILQTNITTIEQTVLYSFNVKIAGEASCTAEDIANSVQQILCFTDTSTM